MARDSQQCNFFRNCFLIIEQALAYTAKVRPDAEPVFREHSFRCLLDALYSSEKNRAVGALVYLCSLSSTSKACLKLFNEYIIETLSGLFNLMNRFSCKFSLTIHKKSYELSKYIILHCKRTVSESERFGFIRKLTVFLVNLIPINKQYEQRVLLHLINNLIEGMSLEEVAQILYRDGQKSDMKLSIEDLLEEARKKEEEGDAEEMPPICKILSHIFQVMRTYKTTLNNKRQKYPAQIGVFKELTYEDCSNLTSLVLIINAVFKWKALNFHLLEANNVFTPLIQEIIDMMLDIIKENEDFNEFKMLKKGSLVVTKPEAMGEMQKTQHSPNELIHYQNLEFKIYIDEYDFNLHAWSLLIEQVTGFLSSFLTKNEINAQLKTVRQQTAPQNPANAQAAAERPAVPAPEESDLHFSKVRERIIVKFFNLFCRVEYRIREAGEAALRQLLKIEASEKEILPQATLEQAFNPILAFIQNQNNDKRLNENSMHAFQKLFQLFKRCFNIKTLFDKLKEYVQHINRELLQTTTTVRDVLREAEVMQLESIFKIFLLLSYKQDELISIIQLATETEKNLKQKNIYYYSLKPKLIKFFDMHHNSSNFIATFTKKKLNQEDDLQAFKLILDVIRNNECYTYREKISKEDLTEFLRVLRTNLDEKRITEEAYNKMVYQWTCIIYELSKKIPFSISRNVHLLTYHRDIVFKFLPKLHALDDRQQSLSLTGVTHADQFIVSLKLLVQHVSNGQELINAERMNTIFILVDLAELRLSYYLNFIKKFLKNTIPASFTDKQKKQILFKYLSLYTETEENRFAKMNSKEHYLRLVNQILIQPIMNGIFDAGDVEHSILFHSDFLQELKRVIESFKIGEQQGAGPRVPTYLLIEISLFLDYILSRVDFKKLTLASDKKKEIDEILQSTLLFSWRNIIRKSEPNKLVINISKLLASKLKVRSSVLDDSLTNIYELYSNVLKQTDDVLDEDNKNVWISICEILIPEVEKAKGDFGPKKQIDPDEWFNEFIACKRNCDPVYTLAREDYQAIIRWWVVIFKNKNLMKSYKLMVLDGFRFYTLLSGGFRYGNIKFIQVLVDMFLLFIIWYCQEHQQALLEGKPTAGILELSPQKEEFLMQLIVESLRKDEESCGPLLNRAYLLFRLYFMFLGRDRMNYDNYITFLNNVKKRNARQTEAKHIRRRIKYNQVVFNVLLAVLNHPRVKDNREKENELVGLVMDFILKEFPQKITKELISNLQLLFLGYHVIKRAIKISCQAKQDEYLEDIKRKSIESLRNILMNPDREARAGENSENISIWFAILLIRLIFEAKPELLRDQIDCLQKLAETICEQMMPKKASRDQLALDEAITFDENQDLLDKLFNCPNPDSLDSKMTSRAYHKGYTILSIRILVKFLDTQSIRSLESQEQPGQNQHVVRLDILMKIFSNLLKLPSSDYELKIEVLMLLRCLIIPQTVKSPVYRPLCKDKDLFEMAHKVLMFQCLKPDNVIQKNEWKQPVTELFLNHYWRFIIDFIE